MKMKFSLALVTVMLTASCIALLNGCGTESTSGGASAPTPLSRLFLSSQSDKVNVFNLNTMATMDSIVFPGGGNIYGVAISPDKNTLYAVDTTNSKIYSYSLTTSTLIDTLEVDTATYGNLSQYVGNSPDGKRVFVPSKNYSGVFVFKRELAHLTLEAFATIETGTTPQCFGVVADNNYAYIGDYANAIIMKYSITQETIVATIEVPDAATFYFIKFNPAKNKIYIPGDNAGMDKAYILDVPTFTFTGTIEIGTGMAPTDIGFTSNGKAYVTNYNDHTVSVINVASNSVTSTITFELVSGPECVIIDNGRHKAYVNDYNVNVLYAIDTNTDTLVATYELQSKGDQMAVKSVGGKNKIGRGVFAF